MNGERIVASLPVAVSRETQARLERFADLFAIWSERINLVAASTNAGFWERHVADSAQLVDIAPEAQHWADLGSGGGFPGVVVAILLSDRPETRVDLIESNRRKAAFLQTVRASCAPVAHIHAERIETIVPRLPAPHIVTARALAPLPTLLDLAEPWLAAGARALFHKGRGYADELHECRAQWDFDLIEYQSQVATDSVILELIRVRRRREPG